eukprot:1178184-Prorocentrum_minimum.AAC.2
MQIPCTYIYVVRRFELFSSAIQTFRTCTDTVPTVPKSCPRPVVSSSDSDSDSDDDKEPPCEEHISTSKPAPAQPSGLPDPLAALSEASNHGLNLLFHFARANLSFVYFFSHPTIVRQAAPEFLNPEATRQIAVLYRPPPPPKAWEGECPGSRWIKLFEHECVVAVPLNVCSLHMLLT